MQKHKLSNLQINSVDLCERGANQEADICLFKSDGNREDRSILKKAMDYLRGLMEPAAQSVTKSEVKAEYAGYLDLLGKSFDRILDGEEASEEKAGLLKKSISEFSEFMTSAADRWANLETVDKPEEIERKDSFMEKHQEFQHEQKEEPPMEPQPQGAAEHAETKKSEAIPEFVTKALQRAEEFITKSELAEMISFAKRYAVLGEDPEELGKKLYEMKKSSPDMYQTCISLLDKQVGLIEKSGLFTEIGRTGGADSVQAGKAEGMAKSLMDQDPSLNFYQAMAKVFENHPELISEYDQ